MSEPFALFDHWLASWLIELAMAALLLFWVVGAYNRLMRLRNALGSAWAQIDQLLQTRAQALTAWQDALRIPLADESTALAVLAEAVARERTAALAARARPADAAALTGWVAAEGALASPLSRLQALAEHRPGLLQDGTVAALRVQLADLQTRLEYARHAYNEAAAVYNAATRQMPTRVLSQLFGFIPAGTA